MTNIRDIEQAKAIEALDEIFFEYNFPSALVVAATGFGKGHLIKLICEKYLDKSILIIVPRVNLVRDLSQRIPGSKIFCASLGVKETGRITIATKQSLKEINAEILILDESHGYTKDFIDLCFKSSKKLLGLTATPYNDNGFIYEEPNNFFQMPCYQFNAKQAINAGILCGYKIHGSQHSYLIKPSNAKRDFTQKEIDEIVNSQASKMEKIVKEIILFSKKYNRKKTVLLCASIKHAEEVNKLLLNNNQKSIIIHSKIPNANEKIEEWKNDNTPFACSVLMLSEGFDCPKIDCVVFLRPTRSTKLAMQAIGRGLRLYENKEHCLILDFAEVIDNCGTPIAPIYNFKKKSKGNNENQIVVKTCNACWLKYQSDSYICPECNNDNTPKRDYVTKLKTSLLNEDDTPYFIFRSLDIQKSGLSKNGKRYMVLGKQSISVTLFGKQIDWFYNISNKNDYVKIYIKKSGKWLNATRLDFGTKNEYDLLSNLSNLELFVQYPQFF